MKYLIFIGLFVAGGAVGYLVGVSGQDGNSVIPESEKEFITEFVYDTIVERERVEVPVFQEESIDVDTALVLKDTIPVLDTLTEVIQPRDSVNKSDDLVIRRDEKINSRIIEIVFLDVEEEKDTLIRELLGINETKITEMDVEFWESPIGFSGYKLSKSKLVMYGVSPQFECEILRKNETYYLTYQDLYFELKETQEFLPYKEIEKALIFND